MDNRPNLKRLTRTALGALLVSGSMIGCSYSPYQGRDDRVEIEEYPRVVADKDTYRNVLFSAAIVEQGTAERPMRVTVPARSRYRRDNLNIQYRFEWLDAAGRPLQRGGNENWRFKALPPRNQVFLDGNALDVGAVDWRVEVRLAE